MRLPSFFFRQNATDRPSFFHSRPYAPLTLAGNTSVTRSAAFPLSVFEIATVISSHSFLSSSTTTATSTTLPITTRSESARIHSAAFGDANLREESCLRQDGETSDDSKHPCDLHVDSQSLVRGA